MGVLSRVREKLRKRRFEKQAQKRMRKPGDQSGSATRSKTSTVAELRRQPEVKQVRKAASEIGQRVNKALDKVSNEDAELGGLGMGFGDDSEGLGDLDAGFDLGDDDGGDPFDTGDDGFDF